MEAVHTERETVRATWMLVLITLLWGLSFPLMKDCQARSAACPGGEAVSGFTLIAVRMALSLVVLGIFQPKLFLTPSLKEHVAGALIAIPFFVGFWLQVLGLAWTTPAASAFITSLAGAWVPLVAWAWFRIRVPAVAWLGAAFGVAGTSVLSLSWENGIGEGGIRWGGGESLTLAASFLFAIEILMLDRLGRKVNSAHLTPAFLGITGLMATAAALGSVAWAGRAPADAATGPAGVAAWFRWMEDMAREPVILWEIGLLTIFCTVLAFHWMNTYQPRVSATRAALIYFLEPVFASAFSIVLGRESLWGQLFLGGGLILAGNALVEAPRWFAARPRLAPCPVADSAQGPVRQE